jgi:hypothetical protein
LGGDQQRHVIRDGFRFEIAFRILLSGLQGD